MQSNSSRQPLRWMGNMSDLLEICRASRLNGRPDRNPHMHTSNAARAYAAGVLMGQRGCASPRGANLAAATRCK